MGEVCVHFEDVLVAVAESPLEACYVGGAKTEFTFALDDEEAVGKFLVDEGLDYVCCTVWGSVVDDEDVEAFFESEDGSYDFFYVFFFVICGYDNDAVTLVHCDVGFIVFAKLDKKVDTTKINEGLFLINVEKMAEGDGGRVCLIIYSGY